MCPVPSALSCDVSVVVAIADLTAGSSLMGTMEMHLTPIPVSSGTAATDPFRRYGGFYRATCGTLTLSGASNTTYNAAYDLMVQNGIPTIGDNGLFNGGSGTYNNVVYLPPPVSGSFIAPGSSGVPSDTGATTDVTLRYIDCVGLYFARTDSMTSDVYDVLMAGFNYKFCVDDYGAAVGYGASFPYELAAGLTGPSGLPIINTMISATFTFTPLGACPVATE